MKCKPSSLERGEARRAQVLDAAEDCFLRFGFHGASMAHISRAASMSAGHIYNYFENKEAIIDAIVERNMEATFAFLDEIASESDISRVILANIGEGVDEKLNSSYTGLMLDVLAEASRNPKFAERLHERDRIIRERLRNLILRSRAQRKGVEPGALAAGEADADLDGQIEILIALFEGLSIRGIANPNLDKAAVVRTMERIVHSIFSG